MKTQHLSEYAAFKNTFVGAITSSIVNTQKNEVISPITSALGGAVANHITTYVQDQVKKYQTAAEDEAKKLKAKQEEEEKNKRILDRVNKNQKPGQGKKTEPEPAPDGGDSGGGGSEDQSHKAGPQKYSEPIGPNEVFYDDYEKIKGKIDKMPMSDDKKSEMKSDVYRVIKAMHGMSSAEQEQVADSIRDRFLILMIRA